MLCAFLLTVLPLPTREAVTKLPRIHINWIPFSNLYNGLKDRDILLNIPSTWVNPAGWKRYLKSGDFFQIAANMVMLTPLGIYLRYYFKCSFKKTLLFGFLTSLFYETTQLSGLYFIYPQPYRCPDVNDLMTNTFGAVLGYAIAPAVTCFLPTREQIDETIWKKGEKVTLTRQFFAAVVDWILIVAIVTALDFISLGLFGSLKGTFLFRSSNVVIVLYFCVLQWIWKGFTPGKRLLRIRSISAAEEEKQPSIWRYFIKYAIIYGAYPVFVGLDMAALMAIIIILLYNDFNAIVYVCVAIAACWVLGSFLLLLRFVMKHHSLPHDYYSKTKVILIKKSKGE